MNEEDRLVAVASIGRRVTEILAARWWRLQWATFQEQFTASLPEMLVEMEAAQTLAAGFGAEFVNGATPGAAARVRPGALAGVASDGRSLVKLLAQPMVQTFTAAARGAPQVVALELGAQSLEQIVATQVEDAARGGERVAMAANTKVSGYDRVVEPGACGRCVILAGRFYRWNDGFLRHPKCRCSNRPRTGDGSGTQDARELFDGMLPAEQDRAFTKAGAEAIRLGADPAQVVNARRGMSTTVTESGRHVKARKTVHGQELYITRAGARRGQVRIMPESILELAKDRADAVRLLKVHNYL